MYKAILIAAALSIPLTALGAEPSVGSLKFEYQNPSNFPLKFTPQKLKWRYEKIRLWGVVENKSRDTYEYVTVSLTALDKNRNFLGRDKFYVDPAELSSGDEGNLDEVMLDTDEKIPAIIQVKIAGDAK
jgi:hypothetical protein